MKLYKNHFTAAGRGLSAAEKVKPGRTEVASSVEEFVRVQDRATANLVWDCGPGKGKKRVLDWEQRDSHLVPGDVKQVTVLLALVYVKRKRFLSPLLHRLF